VVGARHLTPISDGKRHDRQRRAENKVRRGCLVHELLAEVDATGGQSLAKRAYDVSRSLRLILKNRCISSQPNMWTDVRLPGSEHFAAMAV